MSGAEKVGYLLPPYIRGTLLLEVLSPLTKVFLTVKPPLADEILIPWILVGLFLGLHCIGCTLQVAASIRRVRRRLRPGYAPPIE